jgi:hypothetical protein
LPKELMVRPVVIEVFGADELKIAPSGVSLKAA